MDVVSVKNLTRFVVRNRYANLLRHASGNQIPDGQPAQVMND